MEDERFFRTGIFGDETLKRTYYELKRDVDELVPDHAVGKHIKGVKGRFRAKAKAIVLKARALEELVKAATE